MPNYGLPSIANPSGAWGYPATRNGQILSPSTQQDSDIYVLSSEVSRVTTLEQFNSLAGTGSVDADMDAFTQALATGAHISLNKDLTYRYWGDLQLAAGQHLFGNGATLKRIAQATSTTATAVAPGVFSYVLADASAFRVGMTVAFADTGVAQNALVANTTLSTNNPKITAINGNTITLSAAPNKTAHTGHNVYSVGQGITASTGSHIHDIELHGNLTETPWARWEIQSEIFVPSDASYVVIERVYIHDTAGEGIQLRGLYNTISDCWLETLHGNGIHLSATTHATVRNTTVINPNGDQNVGHVMGCIGWSQQIVDTIVDGNYLYGGVAGVSMTGETNSHNTVTNNVIRNATTFGIQCQGNIHECIVANNRVYDCSAATSGGMYLDTDFSQVPQGYSVIVQGNLFNNSPVYINDSVRVSFLDNTLRNGSPLQIDNSVRCKISGNYFTLCQLKPQGNSTLLLTIDGNTFDFDGDTTTTILDVANNGDSIIVRNNTFIGGNIGVACVVGQTNFRCKGNNFNRQATTGIQIGRVAGGTQSYVVDGNICTCGPAGTSANWYGIRVRGVGVAVLNNTVVNPYTSSEGRWGIDVELQSLVNNNTVIGSYGIATIKVEAASTNSTVINNTTTAALVDSGTTTSKVNNNLIL